MCSGQPIRRPDQPRRRGPRAAASGPPGSGFLGLSLGLSLGLGLALLDAVDASDDRLSIDDVCEVIGGIMASVLVGAFAEEEQSFRDALWEMLCDRMEHQYRGMCAAIPGETTVWSGDSGLRGSAR